MRHFFDESPHRFGWIGLTALVFVATVGVTGPAAPPSRSDAGLTRYADARGFQMDPASRGRIGWLFNEGRAKLARGDVNGAVADFAKALWERPNDARIHFHLAQALEARGDHLSALRAYHDAVEFAPANETYRRRLEAYVNGSTSGLLGIY